MGNKKKQSIVGTVNPLVMATGGMSGGCGDPMPSAIHGGSLVGETIKNDSLKKESSIDYPVSEGLCPDIWDTSVDGKFKIKPEIKQRALELVDKLLAK